MARGVDPTPRLARRVAGHLRPGEAVLAAVALALPGTTAARTSGAARAADGVVSFRDGPLAAAKAEAADTFGITGFQFLLVLTDARLLLVRRSAFGRAKEVAFECDLADVAAIRTSTRADTVFVELADGRELRLEPPKALKFLPSVYTELGDRLAAARSA